MDGRHANVTYPYGDYLEAGEPPASFSLVACPGVGPIVFVKPVSPSAGDALQKAQGVGHAGHVQAGVLRLGLVFIRIRVLVVFILGNRPRVGFPHTNSDRLASCQAELE